MGIRKAALAGDRLKADGGPTSNVGKRGACGPSGAASKKQKKREKEKGLMSSQKTKTAKKSGVVGRREG